MLWGTPENIFYTQFPLFCDGSGGKAKELTAELIYRLRISYDLIYLLLFSRHV